jgi:MYXO-CTERM domain-containing protein
MILGSHLRTAAPVEPRISHAHLGLDPTALAGGCATRARHARGVARRTNRGLGGALFAGALLLAPPSAFGATVFEVGPGRAYPDLQAVAPLLRPGDRVEIDGGAVYPGGVVLRNPGTAAAPIVIAGRRVGGARPVIAGGATTLEIRGAHQVIEGLEITGGTARCLFHHADHVVVRDTVVHDCPRHGILGADDDAGSLTLSYVEVYRAGHGDGAHPIYVASDEEAFPGSVFRMEHCYVHDATGGNSVKSRAERNEIYANWIEGALYHELDLVGPDGEGRKRAREDSDVVGNVIRKLGPGYAVRVGGDGTGETEGRYRFVNNTIVLGLGARAAFRLFGALSCVEMHNNAVLRAGGGPLVVVADAEARWPLGKPVIAGSSNWVPMGSTGVPLSWTRTVSGRDPGVASDLDPRPTAGSPLVGAGDPAPSGAPGFAFPAPLAAPEGLPPPRALERVGTARARLRGAVDIGALPYVPPPGPPASPAPRARGCACAIDVADPGEPLAALLAALALMLSRRRR